MSDMMEKDPRQRIQTASEVAERLSPWAEDNSPLREEDLDEKPRWTSPASGVDTQPTDPNMDIAELAMTEISDPSGANATISGDDSATEASGVLKTKAAIPNKRCREVQVCWPSSPMRLCFQ